MSEKNSNKKICCPACKSVIAIDDLIINRSLTNGVPVSGTCPICDGKFKLHHSIVKIVGYSNLKNQKTAYMDFVANKMKKESTYKAYRTKIRGKK